jgi:hypothetical protein
MGIWYSKHMCSKLKICFNFFKLIRQLYYSCPMKRTHFGIIMFLLASVLFFLPTIIFAQQNVGIGTTTPNNSALLDLTATNKGLLVPRMTTAQRIAIVTPATGLLVYDTNFNQFWYFDGTMWVQAIGPMGPTGPQGITGSTGLQGPTGQPGLQGVAGPTGQQGLQGVTGPTGQAGIQGVTGPTGQAGIQGATGPSGTDGAQGPTGLQGIQGVTGPSGLQGIQGITGPSGIDGAQGPTGIQGIQGVTGPSGADGAQGPTGLQGATGLQGPTGADGALNAWALLGNTGTTPGTGAGQNFLGTTDAQDMIIATNSSEHIKVKSSGSIKMTGNFENQELKGNVVTWGAAAITDPASASVTTATPTADQLWVSTSTPCASCLNTYTQSLATYFQQAEVIDGTLQSITITDGNGTDNSGVLVLASVSIKTITSGTLPNGFRYAIWLQRSTDSTFTTSGTNIYKTEDGIASGTTMISGGIAPTAAGASTTTIIFPDLALAPGTYWYRLVFQPLMGSFYGLTPNAQDRSMVLMQIKR